jgi:hypothetical protein
LLTSDLSVHTFFSHILVADSASTASSSGATMSFGYSAGDAILLAQLAWRTLQGTIKACGEHDELTREVSSLHKVLKRLTTELENAESLLNRPGDDRGRWLRTDTECYGFHSHQI